MSMLERLLRPAALNLNDERLWTTSGGSVIGGTATSGVYVGTESALTVSTVWACVRLIAESSAMLPLVTYRRLPNSGREPAPEHPLYDVLHDQPNAEQTAVEWIDQQTTAVLLRGTAYSREVAGPRGPADQLIPVPPAAVEVRYAADGAAQLAVRQPGGGRRPLLREDALIVRGLATEDDLVATPVTGRSVITYARETLGLAIATESFGARSFSQGASPRAVIESDDVLAPDRARQIQERFDAAHAGLSRAHRTAVLGRGFHVKPFGMTNEDAQFLATRAFQVAEVARWFRVPPHMVGDVERSTSWGAGIEQQTLGFVVFTLLPWLKRWELAIRRDLLIAPRQYFVEFNLNGLLRGDTKSRYEAYAIGRQWGWLSANDIRRLENMNPIDGGDQYERPLNMAPAALHESDGRYVLGGHYRLLVESAAERVVAKEIAAMRKAASRCASDAAGWRAAVTEFYAKHGVYVAATLHVPQREAAAYSERQARVLLSDGVGVMGEWGTRGVDALVALATGALERAA